MSVHLVGGGWTPQHDVEVFGPFLAEATARAVEAGRVAPHIAIIAVRDGDAAEHADKLGTALSAGGLFEAVTTALPLDGHVDLSAIADADGIVIGGGVTPAYLRAVLPVAEDIRRLVSAGVPYLGFSAGAMIAAERALAGDRPARRHG
jgi:cyanophycinase